MLFLCEGRKATSTLLPRHDADILVKPVQMHEQMLDSCTIPCCGLRLWGLSLAHLKLKQTRVCHLAMSTGSDSDGDAGGKADDADALGLGYASDGGGGGGAEAEDTELREASAAAAASLAAADVAEGASAQKQAEAAAAPVVTTSITQSASGRLAFAIEPRAPAAASVSSGDAVTLAAGDRSVRTTCNRLLPLHAGVPPVSCQNHQR